MCSVCECVCVSVVCVCVCVCVCVWLCLRSLYAQFTAFSCFAVGGGSFDRPTHCSSRYTDKLHCLLTYSVLTAKQFFPGDLNMITTPNWHLVYILYIVSSGQIKKRYPLLVILYGSIFSWRVDRLAAVTCVLSWGILIKVADWSSRLKVFESSLTFATTICFSLLLQQTEPGDSSTMEGFLCPLA